MPIQKQDRRQRLVLGRCGDIAPHGKMGQKHRHLGLAHLRRMPLALEQDKPLDPIDVALLGAQAVMPAAQYLAHMVQQPGLGRRLRRRIRSIHAVHANHGFVWAFSVPKPINGLIGLKDDKQPCRMTALATVFRRPTLS
jgi:hypothetical protein